MKGTIFKYEDVKIFVENCGYNLISDKYIDIKTKMIFSDDIGYLFYDTYDNLKQTNTLSIFHKANPYTNQNIKL